jgi:hypothetical protein
MTSLPRIASIAVGTIGIGAAAGRLAYDTRPADRGPDGIVATGAGVGAGSLALLGGTAAARSAEQALRPGIARAGRTTAALGAALVAGSLLGEVAARFLGVADGRRSSGDVRDELAKQQARIDAPQDATKRANSDAARYERLAEEFTPLPTTAAERPRPADGRIDLAGAPIGAAARALHQRYDVNDDDVLGLDERQRPIAAGSASIATLMSIAHAATAATAKRDEPITIKVADLEQVIADEVDTGGITGVIDNDEATAWFGPDGVGEKTITWDGADAFVASVASPAHSDEYSTYAPGPWRPGGDDILYLPGVYTESAAKEQLAGLSADRHPAAVLVKLPEDAPTSYGVMSLLIDGEAKGKPYDDILAKLKLDSAVVAVQGRGDLIDL